MSWIIIVFIVAAAAVLARIFVNVRKVQSAEKNDWDSKMIAHLRSQGGDPFQPYLIDFFFALPSEAACRQVQTALEAEGFEVDAKAVPENADQPFSLHAAKALRLSVPDMRAFTRRFSELAASAGGRYDGWAAAGNVQRFSV
jgi:hypothetical protein